MTQSTAVVHRPPTQRELKDYFELLEEKRGYERLSRALDSDIALLSDVISNWLRAETKGKVERIKRRLGYVLKLITLPGRVAWKSEYVRKFGHERAVELQEQAPLNMLVVS